MSEAAAAAAFNTRQIGYLPGVLGFDWVELCNGYAFGRFEIAQQHLAPKRLFARRFGRRACRHRVRLRLLHVAA